MASANEDIIARAAELDPEIRNRIQIIANLALDKAEFYLRHGTPQVQSQIASKFLGIMAGQLKSQEADTELEEMRQAMRDLTAAVTARTPGVRLAPVEQQDDIEIDRPGE